MRRLVLELTRSSIRALLVEGQAARPRIRRVMLEPLDGPPSAETLQRLLKPFQPAKSELINVISREQTLTRTLTLPSTQRDELDSMIRLAAKAQLPYPPEQAALDWTLIEAQEGNSLVQLVACQREWVDRHLGLLRQAGLRPDVLTPSSWGVAAWYQRFGASPVVQEPVMVVHIDTERTDLVLMRQGRVVFSRNLNQGAGEWSASLEPLLQELERSLTSVRKELPRMEAASVVCTGIGSLETWRAALEQRVGLPVVVRQGDGDLALPMKSRDPSASERQGSLVVMMGLAVSDVSSLINLLPSEARKAKRQRRRIRELALTGSLLAVMVVVGAGLLLNLVRRKSQETHQTIERVQQLESITRHTEQQLADLRLIERLVTSRRKLAESLAALIRLTPQAILFESLSFERARRELVIRGNAPTTREVLEYLKALKQEEGWARVELRYSARRSNAADARTDFEIVLEIS